MRENEMRMECLKLAVSIAHRDANNDVKQIVALASELCDYVDGGLQQDSASGGVETTIPPKAKSKK